eukprot:scaffold72847_cov17-Prasinocladus_malaysianus.AAC.1
MTRTSDNPLEVKNMKQRGGRYDHLRLRWSAVPRAIGPDIQHHNITTAGQRSSNELPSRTRSEAFILVL